MSSQSLTLLMMHASVQGSVEKEAQGQKRDFVGRVSDAGRCRVCGGSGMNLCSRCKGSGYL